MKSLKIVLVLSLLMVIFGVLIAENKNENSLSISPYPEIKEQAVITATVKNATIADITITDLKGVVVKTVFSGELEPGANSFNWDRTDYAGNSLPSGKYWVELNTQQKYTSVKKIIILK